MVCFKKKKMAVNETPINFDDLHDLIETHSDIIIPLIDDIKDLYNAVFDFSLPEKFRIHYFNLYYYLIKDDTIEIVNRLSGMYTFSGTTVLHSFLLKIVYESEISAIFKYEAVQSLLSFFEEEEIINEKNDSPEFQDIKLKSNESIQERNKTRSTKAYDALYYVCSNLDNSMNIIIKIQAIIQLMNKKEYKISSLDYFNHNIIHNKELETNFRYKTVLSLEKNIIDIDLRNYYLKEIFLDLFFKIDFEIGYRILSAQYLLQNFIKEIDDDSLNEIQSILLEIGNTSDLEINTRADAIDVVLTLGTNENYKTKAKEYIIQLGNTFGKARTVFENSQNVHVSKIDDSAKHIVDIISSYSLVKKEDDNDNEIDFNYVADSIRKRIENNLDDEMKNKIEISLNRILIDRTIYHTVTLCSMLLKLWSYISLSEHKEEMTKRLIEELIDMSGTCSSGYITRLANTISGFNDNLSIQISKEDQLVANFIGRLNLRIRNITNPKSSPFFTTKWKDVLQLYLNYNKLYLTEPIMTFNKHAPKERNLSLDERCKLIENDYYKQKKTIDEMKEEIIDDFASNIINIELSTTSSKHSERQCFLLFFRTYISEIREELFTEFQDIFTESDFDLTLRKAMSIYEGEF